MTHDQFNKYLSDLGSLQRMKTNGVEKLKTLHLEWETDVSKIDFSVLLNPPRIPALANFCIEWFDAQYLPGTSGQELTGDLNRFLGIYELIEKGVKIIPPISHRQINFVDGEFQVSKVLCPSIADGNHRVQLAKHLRFEKIPVLFIEQPYECYFSKDKWNLAYKDGFVEFTNICSETKHEFQLSAISFQLTRTGDYRFVFEQF